MSENHESFNSDPNKKKLTLSELIVNELRGLLRQQALERKYQKLSEEEKEILQRFEKYYSICPICRTKNDETYIRKFYFDESNVKLREQLIKLINFQPNQIKLKLYIGIPCCRCFLSFFED